VSDSQYLVTFAVMLVVSLLISTLAVRVRAHAEQAARREQRTRVLYSMSRDLGSARTLADVASAVSRHVSEALQGSARVLLPQPDGRLAPAGEGSSSDARESAVAQWAFDHGRPAGLGTDTLPAAAQVYVPLRSADAPLGVLGVRPAESLLPLTHDSLDLLEGLARLAASGVERVRLAEESEEARLAVEAERMRNTLSSAVSRDLRTPLATITRAASALLAPDPDSPETEQNLKETIYDEAERVNRLVAHLLDMTRPE